MASADPIEAPAHNQVFQGTPSTYSGEVNDPVPFGSYAPFIRLEIEKIVGLSFYLAARGHDSLALNDDWDVNFATMTRFNEVGDPIMPGTPLSDGQYRIRLTQPFDSDPLNDDVWFSTFFIDSNSPDTFIDTATPGAPTNNGVRTFTFHGEDPPPGTAVTLECRIDGGAWFTVGCDGDYTTANLPEGNHTFGVRATDAAGNVDATPAISTWMIDQTDPEITITKPAMRERFTLDQHVPSVFSCNDPLAGGPPQVASGIQTCSGPSNVDTSQLGNFRFVVNAVDNAGNTHQVVHSYAVDPPKYADVINANHPIAYYRLGDPLGSVPMSDSSGNNRHGEFKNGIALRRPPAPSCHIRPHAPYTCDLNADPQDWSAFFPARDGYGFTNNITAPTTAYTWEAWIKRADNNDGMIAAHGGGGQLFVKDGRLALRQTQDTVYASGPHLTPGEWFHVAGTWNGSTTRLYVNGNLVGSSNSANKAPSGTATLYVGYGDQAPWFHGSIDEAAYYGSALSQSALRKRWVVGTAKDVPSPVLGPPIQRPSADIHSPANGGLYAVSKLPPLDFECNDLDGDHTVASCTATVDGNPILTGGILPDTPGPHVVVVTAVDDDGLTRSHTHTYTIKSFQDIYNTDSPLVYYRLGDATGDPMTDSGPQGRHGTYKNDQDSGPIGISGDLNLARKFYGAGGYGFVSSIPAPTFQSTIEAWVNPDDLRNQSVVGHGDAGEIYIQDGLFVFKHMGTSVTSHIGPTPGVFTQVVGVWDGVTISIYVDGELHGQVEATKRPSSSSTFYVGYGE
ncbi:MAG: LamG-like jellyroll fold domain-containing protein, partial [Solirubrobacterales bacterium]